MTMKRIVTIGVLCGAVAVWMAAAATSDQHPIAPSPDPTARAVEASGEALASEIARLRERLRPSVVPLQTRDVFRYVASPSSVPPSSPRPDAPPAHEAPEAPPLRLIGIAEDGVDGGIVRTAIVSGYGQVFLVKDGEALTDRFRVSTVRADAVELVDATDQTTLRLAIQ